MRLNAHNDDEPPVVTKTFTRIDEGDNIKAVVSDPTFTLLGTVDGVAILSTRVVIKDGEFFSLRLRAEDRVPELFVDGESHGKIEELEIL